MTGNASCDLTRKIHNIIVSEIALNFTKERKLARTHENLRHLSPLQTQVLEYSVPMKKTLGIP